MNPIAVSGTPGTVVFPGVAEAAAAGSAAPSSVVDLFCQMLAAAQAGVAIAGGAESPDECTEGECELPESAQAESIDASALAAAMATVSPTAVATNGAVGETTVPPVDMRAEALLAAAVVAFDAADAPDEADVAEGPAAPPPTDTPETAAPPAMSLAMQAALARVGLGAEGAITTRRFGDAAVTLARPVQPVEASPDDAAAPLRELAQPSVKRVEAEQAETDGDGENSAGDFFKPMANLPSPKAGGAIPFHLNTQAFSGAEIQAAAQGRTEPLLPAAQPNVPQSVSVRDVGDVVVRSVQYLSGRTEDVVTVRLVPQSLGELRIVVHSGERGMEVVLTAANNAARDALETNLAGLREALGRDGMVIERVSVQVFAPFDAGHQPASSQHNAQGGASSSARQPNTAYRESSGSPPQHQNNSEQQARRQQHSGRLNMWV